MDIANSTSSFNQILRIEITMFTLVGKSRSRYLLKILKIRNLKESTKKS